MISLQLRDSKSGFGIIAHEFLSFHSVYDYENCNLLDNLSVLLCLQIRVFFLYLGLLVFMFFTSTIY